MVKPANFNETMASTSEIADEEVNQSLDDVVEMLTCEIERLKLSLETIRLSEHPDKQNIIRWHVRTLDERQDRLEELRVLLQASEDTPVH